MKEILLIFIPKSLFTFHKYEKGDNETNFCGKISGKGEPFSTMEYLKVSLSSLIFTVF